MSAAEVMGDPCERCGTDYDRCTDRILRLGIGACCGVCKYTDTHNVRRKATTTADLITTSTGTSVRLTTREATGDRIVVLDNPAAPDDMRLCEAGRIIDGGFQPASFAAWALTPEALRAIATLIERQS